MIIITGNSGFVGTNLRSYLQKKNKKIVGVSRSPSEGGVDYKNINTTSLSHLNNDVKWPLGNIL